MPDYHAIAAQAAQQAGIDPGLFSRQIQVESKFNPNAYNASSGATGIAQIVPRWHPGVNPSDPVASLYYAARLDANYYGLYKSWPRALAAYNWGQGRVEQWNGQRSTLPKETRDYLDIILGTGWESGGGGSWIPGLPTLPSLPDAGSIGTGIFEGVKRAAQQAYDETFRVTGDIAIDRFSGPILTIAGIALIGGGLFSIALRSASAVANSPEGRGAIKIAEIASVAA